MTHMIIEDYSETENGGFSIEEQTGHPVER